MSLLFRLSGYDPSLPEVATGCSKPNFLRDVVSIEDDRFPHVLRCKPTQLLSYWAPGNIYSERGTISFFWRSREELGETEFPLFRVSFADHSSWDALFIRIDWNGHGIDAFATDINLSRMRISSKLEPIPSKEDWIHIAFSWDENVGVILFINGKEEGRIVKKSLLYAGLDQFGTHSRVISNAQVQSSYNYMRTGDFAEIQIYDQMLDTESIQRLSKGEQITSNPFASRSISDSLVEYEWMHRFGFDNDNPPYKLNQNYYVIRKVEIPDAWDLKRWWWKACDGIRETTWPGVYNRSRLPGRLDYFVLPDWDCYSLSGKKITFVPEKDKEFNNIQISGSATGRISFHGIGEETVLSMYRTSSERSSINLTEQLRNVSIEFENDLIEEPIGDISLFDIFPGKCKGKTKDEYYLCHKRTNGTESILSFIKGRMMEDESFTLYGTNEQSVVDDAPSLPFANVIIRYERGREYGLDGVELVLPKIKNAQKDVDFNIQIKDPLWQYRNLMNVNFRVSGKTEKTIFFDSRDRILPKGGNLYITIASSVPLSSEFFSKIKISLIWKTATEAKAEHIADRMLQVKDNYANLVEENPSNEHFNMFNRFKADLDDLLDIDPENRLAQEYYFDKFKENKPSFELTTCPDGIPIWAWRQTEYMGYIKRFLRWWIDKRQIFNGEFGGGLSDDGDLTAWWPGPAIAGCMPDKISESLKREMEAFYDQGMFANGLCAIQTDQLHTLEDGVQALGQCLTLFPTDPLYLERALDNARGIEFVTGITEKGHRHFMSGYYSGTRVAMEHPWRYSASDSFHVLHPTYMLARYNGNPKARKMILELADSMMEHYYNGKLHVLIDTVTEEDQIHERTREWPLFYAAYDLTGNKEYLKPIAEELYLSQQDRLPSNLEDAFTKVQEKYEKLIEDAELRQYINTDGQLWVDRCVIDIASIQEDRCGGIAHIRFSLYPRNYIRWNFEDGRETDVAILVTYGSKRKVELVAYNLSDSDVSADIGFDGLMNGKWKMNVNNTEKSICINRFDTICRIIFEPGYNKVSLIIEKEEKPERKADLAISPRDVIVRDDCLRIVVHNIGGSTSDYVKIVLKDKDGKILRYSNIPPIEAPDDLYPKKLEIPLWTRGLDLHGCSLEIDPDEIGCEITRRNNIVELDDVL